MSPEEAHKWLLEGEVEVFSNPFEDPPEAAAEAEPGATIYIRVPAALKRRVEEAAGAEKVSGNVWAMRCVEDCLADEDDRRRTRSAEMDTLADIWNVAASFRAFDDRKFTHEVAREAFGVICDLAEELFEKTDGKKRLGKRFDQLAADRGLGSGGEKYAQMFKAYDESQTME